MRTKRWSEEPHGNRTLVRAIRRWEDNITVSLDKYFCSVRDLMRGTSS